MCFNHLPEKKLCLKEASEIQGYFFLYIYTYSNYIII